MSKGNSILRNLSRIYAALEDSLYYPLAPAYDLISWLVSLGQWDRWRKLPLPHIVGACVLEVGFGTGVLLAELARRGYVVFGLDLSPSMHSITSARIAKQKLHVDLVRGIVQSMPLTAACFDAIIRSVPFPPRSFLTLQPLPRSSASSLQTGVSFLWIWFSSHRTGFYRALRTGLGF